MEEQEYTNVEGRDYYYIIIIINIACIFLKFLLINNNFLFV